MLRYITPFLIFLILVALFIFGLQNDPREIPSPLINKPAPKFLLPTLHNPEKKISNNDIKNNVFVINVWASWCVACRLEHPILIEAADKKNLKIYGLNYKDKRKDALKWLDKLGNPYIESAFDEMGKTGIDYGVYGVPETFVLDKNGIIRYKHIGPVDKNQLEKFILPLVKKLEISE